MFNSYSKAYNKRYGHSGTLFEGNYWAAAVEDEAYLAHLCCYIHANPVIHGLVDDPADWPYSNYLEWIGEREGTLVDRDFIRSWYPNPLGYREFVAQYIAERRLSAGLADGLRDWEA